MRTGLHLAVIGLSIVSWAGTAHAQDTFFLSDTLLQVDDASLLTVVTLDAGTATLTPLPVPSGTGEVPYEHIDVIAMNPAGTRLYFIDDNGVFDSPVQPTATGIVGYVDLADGTITEVGVIQRPTGGQMFDVCQGAFAGDETFYITHSNSDALYTADLTEDGDNLVPTTLVGEIQTAAGTTVDVKGADIAFASNGELYLFTNFEDSPALRGLYRLALPPSPGTVVATHLGADDLPLITGMAVRDGGRGELVVSAGGPSTNTIITLDRTTGDVLEEVSMTFAGAGFVHRLGDMSNAVFEAPECFLVLSSGPGTGTGTWSYGPEGHPFTTQLGEVQRAFPVTLDDLPTFPIQVPAPRPEPLVHFLRTALPLFSRHALDLVVRPAPHPVATQYAQVLMWNPEVFPQNPEQSSNGLVVTTWSNGTVSTMPYGLQDGMALWLRVFRNADGVDVYQLPFGIDW
jgi:hypothetical protein